MYLAFNNDSTISFNITVCCTFIKCHILPSCVHFTSLSYCRKINSYSYSYYCVINSKKCFVAIWYQK